MKIICQNYNIVFENRFENLTRYAQLKSYSNIFVLCDENTEKHCLPLLSPSLPPFYVLTIESGEKHKKLETCKGLWIQLMQSGADRKSLVINLGGGVIGDMGGFCASTYMRGIDFIQIPTTLLSMVDASVGSKLGIDLEANKNLVGIFNNPKMVWIHTGFLKTLPKQELQSGFAEVIKHALIRDSSLWYEIQDINDISSNNNNWDEIINRSVLIKKDVVEKDPKEDGLRKILNFGHSIGHAVESENLLSKNPLTHGAAVAIGMVCESYISMQKSLLDKETMLTVHNYIKKHYELDAIYVKNRAAILSRLAKDKKNENGKMLFSLITKIGDCSYNIEVSEQEVLDCFDYYVEIDQ